MDSLGHGIGQVDARVVTLKVVLILCASVLGGLQHTHLVVAFGLHHDDLVSRAALTGAGDVREEAAVGREGGQVVVKVFQFDWFADIADTLAILLHAAMAQHQEHLVHALETGPQALWLDLAQQIRRENHLGHNIEVVWVLLENTRIKHKLAGNLKFEREVLHVQLLVEGGDRFLLILEVLYLI